MPFSHSFNEYRVLIDCHVEMAADLAVSVVDAAFVKTRVDLVSSKYF